MRIRLATTATGGAIAGVAATHYLQSPSRRLQAQSAAPQLCGSYELTSVWRSAESTGVESQTALGRSPLQDKTRQCMPRRMSGLLVYQDDGRMWTQCSTISDNQPASYTGYSGRWWLHDQRAFAANYTHGDPQHVEHFVKSASEPGLVGETVTQQVQLSDDGHRLTTTDVRILFGERCVTEVLEWKRLPQ